MLPGHAQPASAADPLDHPPRRGQRVAAVLGALERLALACPPLQRLLVATHARALARLLPHLTCPSGQPTPRRPLDPTRDAWSIAVVGGGLFPRTALALARVWPAARVTIVDADAAHLERARRLLADPRVTYLHATWDPHARHAHDLVILPLALVGDRDAVYTAPGPPRLVHDWLWHRRGDASTVVAWWLFKRLNLVAPRPRAPLD